MHVGADRGLGPLDQYTGYSANRSYNNLLLLGLRHGGAEGTTIHY